MPAAQRISFDVTDEEGVIAYNPHCIDKKKGIAVNFPVKMVVWACDEDVTFDTWDSVEQGLRRQFSTAMEAPDEDGKVYWIDADEVFYSEYEPDYRDGEGFSNVEEYIEWYKEQIRDSEVDKDSSYGGAIVNLTKDGALDEVELGHLQFFEGDPEGFDEDEDEDEDGYVEFDDVNDVYNDFVSDVCEESGYPEDLDEDRIYDDFCNLLDEWNEGDGRGEYDDVRDYLEAHLDVDDYIPEDDEDEEDEDEEDDE